MSCMDCKIGTFKRKESCIIFFIHIIPFTCECDKTGQGCDVQGSLRCSGSGVSDPDRSEKSK